MKLKVLISILLLLNIFIYNLYGDYNNPAWSCSWYSMLSIYIIVNVIEDLKQCFIVAHKIVLISVMVYFIYFLLSEIIVIIYPNLFNDLISNVNLWLSGAVLILSIFLLLTYLIFIKNDKKSIHRRYD